MNLEEMLKEKNFVVVGNTVNPEKFAYKIKNELLNNGYNVECVGYELNTINESSFDNFILNLCIHPIKGIKLLKENQKNIKAVLIQPGAESEEIDNYLRENKIEFLHGCILVGLRLYKF